jgi:hypothetical protein
MYKDYLGFNVNPYLSPQEKSRYNRDKAQVHLEKNGYWSHVYGRVNGKYLMVCSNPKPFEFPLPDYKFIWHQSEWESQRSVAEFFAEVFGMHNANSILCHGKISRLDVWLDGDIPFDIYMQSVYRPRLSCPRIVPGIFKSCYFGDVGLKRAIIYEKNLDKLDFKLFKKTSSFPTRTEVRYFWKAVPIKTYSDYINMVDMRVFDLLKTNVIYKRQFYELSKSRKVDPETIQKFLRGLQKYGFHHARKVSNHSHHFYRSIEPLIRQTSIDLHLSERWQRKVRDEIVGDFDIHSFFNQGLG